MEIVYTDLFLVIGSIFVCVLCVYFFYRKFSQNKNKSISDKLLLKQLLEGFGLEVPSELEEEAVSVIKSIKHP